MNVSGLGYFSMWDSCKHGNEYVGPLKGGGLYDKLRNYQLRNRDSVLWS